MPNTIYTYRVNYDDIDGFGSIEFCAENKNEAIQLFNQWCIIDNKLHTLIKINSIEIVYNSEDAKEYAGNYGK